LRRRSHTRPLLLDWESFTKLIRSIWVYTGPIETRTAMKLMALLYPRRGELRQAEWTEFDLDKATWTIPEERAKM
jgi:integrase